MTLYNAQGRILFSQMIPLRIPLSLYCGKPMLFERYVKFPQLSSPMDSYGMIPNPTRSGRIQVQILQAYRCYRHKSYY
jgi:hypothetical protein